MTSSVPSGRTELLDDDMIAQLTGPVAQFQGSPRAVSYPDTDLQGVDVQASRISPLQLEEPVIFNGLGEDDDIESLFMDP